MVPNTSDDLPDPETPVNTVSRRLGISTLTSFRLFSRAPWTRIKSWLSAACGWEESFERLLVGVIPPFSPAGWIVKRAEELAREALAPASTPRADEPPPRRKQA